MRINDKICLIKTKLVANRLKVAAIFDFISLTEMSFSLWLLVALICFCSHIDVSDRAALQPVEARNESDLWFQLSL